MTHITKHSHSIVLDSSFGKQGIHVRKFIMQLGSIELLNVNTETLHKVNITKQNPREGYAISTCLAQRKES
jgi:hypothetical protein